MVDAITGLSGKLAPTNKTAATAVGRGAAAGSEPSKVSSETSQVVNLSPETTSLQKTLGSEPPVDSGKVSRIKAAIAAGEYPVDVEKITDSLMEYHNTLK